MLSFSFCCSSVLIDKWGYEQKEKGGGGSENFPGGKVTAVDKKDLLSPPPRSGTDQKDKRSGFPFDGLICWLPFRESETNFPFPPKLKGLSFWFVLCQLLQENGNHTREWRKIVASFAFFREGKNDVVIFGACRKNHGMLRSNF